MGTSLKALARNLLLRAYIVVALAIASALTPLVFSFVPVLLLLLYLYLWRWRISVALCLLTDCYMFLAIAGLLAPAAGPFLSLVIALPALIQVTFRLTDAAKLLSPEESRFVRGPTGVYLILIAAAASTLAISLLLGSLSLLLAGRGAHHLPWMPGHTGNGAVSP